VIEDKMSGRLRLNPASGLFVFLILSSAALAQQAASQSSSPEHRAFKDLLDVQRSIWASPVHVKGHDLKWLVPFAAASAALIATDEHVSRELTTSQTGISISSGFSNAGLYSMFGAVGALYLDGHLAHEESRIKTGLLAGEAIVSSTIAVELLKAATNRQKPNAPNTEGEFWAGGTSFPSGHSITAWSTAAVLADRYPHRFWVKLTAYGLASAISFSRCTGKEHYPSDVVVGGVLGYLIGHYIGKR
jgi:membrane-associated phospholipid phosphatase